MDRLSQQHALGLAAIACPARHSNGSNDLVRRASTVAPGMDGDSGHYRLRLSRAGLRRLFPRLDMDGLPQQYALGLAQAAAAARGANNGVSVIYDPATSTWARIA